MTAPVDYRNAAVYRSTCGPEAKGILYSIGNPPGGPPRGNALSIRAMSSPLRRKFPTPAFSAACSVFAGFGDAETQCNGARVLGRASNRAHAAIDPYGMHSGEDLGDQEYLIASASDRLSDPLLGRAG